MAEILEDAPPAHVGRALCADVSREHSESLAATASRIDHWLLVEYRGVWSHDALAGSGLSDSVKSRLGALVAARRARAPPGRHPPTGAT